MLRTLFSALALLTFTSFASAQADETRCRSAESIHYARANGTGTATGLDTDHIVIRNNQGGAIVSRNIAWLRQNRPLYLGAIVSHSGGQHSLRFDYWYLLYSHPALRAGSVEIWRGNTLIDRDSIL